MISGPRQSGKTTLAEEIASEGMRFLSLDDPTQLAAARRDPVGFLRGVDRAVIDEIQRVPDLLLAIKTEVDKDPRPGRFILTASANLMSFPKVADSLAGRMEVIQLLPMSQAEMRGGNGAFLDRAFSGNPPSSGNSVLGDSLVDLVLAGGYPEALKRSQWLRQRNWHLHYADAIIQRDVREVAQVAQLGQMQNLLKALARHTGQLVNYSGIGAALGMNHVTTRKYMQVLEGLYLTNSLQPWFTSKLSRLVKSPKLHFLDSGLAASLKGDSPEQIAKDRTAFGPILETFAVSEMLKIASWSNQRFAFSHFRNKDGVEVDLVIENPQGGIVGIEIKASATVDSSDFSGLRKLASASGGNFIQGIVLYDHDQVAPFGPNLYAAPIASLWA